jgi:L-iditol 2-dehydrogenase
MDILMQATRRKGQVALVGESGDYAVHVSDGMIRNGLTLHGIWHWNLTDAPDMLAMIEKVGPSLDRFITHRFTLDRIEEAWKLQMTGQCGKVIVHPQA